MYHTAGWVLSNFFNNLKENTPSKIGKPARKGRWRPNFKKKPSEMK